MGQHSPPLGILFQSLSVSNELQPPAAGDAHGQFHPYQVFQWLAGALPPSTYLPILSGFQ